MTDPFRFIGATADGKPIVLAAHLSSDGMIRSEPSPEDATLTHFWNGAEFVDLTQLDPSLVERG